MTTMGQNLVKLLDFRGEFRQETAKIRQPPVARYALDGLISKDEQSGVF